MTYFFYALFALGCTISLHNFYLSFLSYPVYRLNGGEPNNYHWTSGVPAVGSLLILCSLAVHAVSGYLLWFGVACAIIDTGGLHWFIGTMLWMKLRGTK